MSAPPRLVFVAPILSVVGFAVLVVFGCRGPTPTSKTETPAEDPPAGPAWFEDVTESSGLNFLQDPGPAGSLFMPQSMGSGCAWLDFDGDGLQDCYLLQFGGPDSKSVNRLFRQVSPGQFQDVTDGSGVGVNGWNHGVAVGDVNNDGRPDIALSQYGGLRLFVNRGGGKFDDLTPGSGLLNLSWGMSAAFLDYDRDGWLDLLVVNYLEYDAKKECFSPQGKRDYCGPSNFPGVGAKLFRNRGAKAADTPAAPRYEDVSFASGVGRIPGPGLGVACADFDGDGWQDIFVANDGAPNRLWVNKHDGTFADEGLTRGAALTLAGTALAGMGVAVGDINNDGLLDLYVTHMDVQTNTLWRQGPRGLFRDVTGEADLLRTRWRGTGFGTVMADFDNDGAVDIAVANGRVFRDGPARDTHLGYWETYADRNQLLVNDGTGKFRDASLANPALSRWNVGRGLACADFDNDGAPDLLITSIGDKARLLRNVAPNRGHWLKVRAIDPKLNREAYGAEVRVRAAGKDRVRLQNPAESYLASSSAVLHFGLGAAAAVESVAVEWPDGTKEVFPGGPADRAIELRKGEGRTP